MASRGHLFKQEKNLQFQAKFLVGSGGLNPVASEAWHACPQASIGAPLNGMKLATLSAG